MAAAAHIRISHDVHPAWSQAGRAGLRQRVAGGALAIALASTMCAPFAANAYADGDLMAGSPDFGYVEGASGASDAGSSRGGSAAFAGQVNDISQGGGSADGFSDAPDGTEAVELPKGSVPTLLSYAQAWAIAGGSVDDLISRASYAVFPVIPNPTTEAFIESIAEPARKIGQKDGLYASVMIAQAILESGSGSSGLSKPPYNNLFGIKGSYRGSSVVLMTSEDDGAGNKYDIAAGFRSYPSVKESLQDYADLLKRDMGSYYAPAWKANARTYVQACNYMQGHYATDTTYSGKLQGLIIAYDLTQYDKPAAAAKTKKAKHEKAKSLLAAVTAQAPIVLSPQTLSVEKNLPEAVTATAAEQAVSQAPAGTPAAQAGEPETASQDQPLSDRGVQVSLVSLAALVAFFAKNELVLLASAASKALARLPFLAH